ncbi:uncharacterized protein TRIADDRAFT_32784 [Trichoplax adhaerens]|uniref:Thymidylate kinase n=1 Tax=Trichoplax adhaerens TaxID=10228 RepID=B3SBN8_TRIAD|nr:hypothetical protein TRIADDRAFT_32784 [Trichoplax adhaerens]EDV19916.1 hypothetical protein TRIADDRAFT_32784 [Trichoplax adhaerens]|eukprot:XP_002117658.1 hypothetical protein TRIADDRAFT_32784 [Trichoplax adhaerens]
MATDRNRGALIIIEGGDRTGKSTQSKMLVDALLADGKQAELVKFPDRTTPIGKLAGSYLQKTLDLEDHAIHLIFSANRWEKVPSIIERLENGITLVVDRYAFSGVAYTSAKRGFDIEWCKQSDTGIPAPDLVIYLTLPVDQATSRDQYGTERYESTQFQKRAVENFEKLMTKNWTTLDASQSIDAIHQQMKDLTTEIMQQVGTRSIEKLWV